MLFVICQLFFATTVGFVYRFFHAVRHAVCIHDYFSIDIAGGASCCLGQRTVGTEEPFFVCIQNGDQRHFGQVQTFTKQIHTHQYIINALT